jgi:dihydropteroate synthase
MGIVNITADSFSDGGRFVEIPRAIEHALRLHEEGADLVDVGGESTRPGAVQVEEGLELERVIPVVEALVARGIEVSVDTMKPRVMREAIRAGAAVVNDVNAFQAEGAIDAVAHSGARLIVMHMLGTPATMQNDPHYDDVVAEVEGFLLSRASCLASAGVARERIALDPGFGFGKTVAHNKQLFHALRQLASHGHPVVAGLSRKKMLGDFTGRAVTERAAASVAAALLAVQNGAAMVRVHDVRETVDAINVWMNLR